MSRSRLLLLLAVSLLAIWYAWTETPRQKRLANGDESAAVSASSTTERILDVTDLDFSGGEEHPYSKPLRDLFGSPQRAPVVVRPVIRAPELPPVVIVPPTMPPPVLTRPVLRVPVGVKPIPALNVLGFLRKGESTTVFLSSQRGDLYLVKKGDRFADGLLVRELDQTKMVVSRGQNDPGVTLTIGEKKMQRMPIPRGSSSRPSVPFIPPSEPQNEPPTPENGKVEVDP